jgi:hypothetical protein
MGDNPAPVLDDAMAQRFSAFLAMAGTNNSIELVQLLSAPRGPAEENKEKSRIAQRMIGFNARDNEVWKEITSRFGANLKHPELLSIANVLATNAMIKLDRDAKRRKAVLIKWFHEHWAEVSPFLDYVTLEAAQ